MKNASQLTREGSQLWNPTSEQLTAHAADLISSSANPHANNFPPSRHCTEQFTGPAGPNPDAALGEDEAVDSVAPVMIDFTSPNVREQIAESERLEMVGASRREFPSDNLQVSSEVKATTKVPLVIHNPYSLNKTLLSVDPDTLAIERREQSIYFDLYASQTRERIQQKAPQIRALNSTGIIFMPPRPPSVESFDVFVKGGATPDAADDIMTRMIYRWYSLCSVNFVTYANWYAKVHGPISNVPPPNPRDFCDLAEWCFEASTWWESVFSTHQGLRHHSRSAAIAAGSAAPIVPKTTVRVAEGHSGVNTNRSNVNGASPSLRVPAVPTNAKEGLIDSRMVNSIGGGPSSQQSL